jgi:hypothetical protein|tara:strand:- start:174 stop:479 length:306 start_codon:yes stop_codon:yes gene_type:complete
MAIAKAITYENLPEEHKKDPKIIPFEYKRPFLQEIEEYLRDKEGDQTSIGIVGQLAKSNQDEERRLMGGYLVGKGFSENEILRMPFDVLTDLFNSVMGIRE